jgi:hypothetical protein
MITIGISAHIYRPLKQVFDYVINPENDFQWQYGTLASSALSPGAPGMGSTFRSVSHMMGRRIECTYQVTDFEPNKRYGFKSLSGPVETRTLYTFDISQSSTQIRVSTEIDQKDLFHESDAMLEKIFRRQCKENLAILKSLLEARRLVQA